MPKNPITKKAKAGFSNVPLRLPDDLKSQVEEVAISTKLNEQETMRQAIRRGLPILKKLLTLEAA